MRLSLSKLFFFLLTFICSGHLPASITNDSDTIKNVEVTDSITDEFTDFDEFSDFIPANDSLSDSCQTICSKSCEGCPNAQKKELESSGISKSTLWILSILVLTMVAGILVRYRRTRPWRVFFLLGAVVFLGFVREPCPCMISSFENTVLMASGAEVQWIHLLWFLALIPITYIFGRVFCGWICHLGAIQELLYRPGRLRILTSKSAIRYMKISQYVLFFGLIIQLLVQQKIFWCTIDPFLSIFQLMLARKYEILSVFLIALILISSVLSFRPFCRAACPIGLVLGWIEKIPGASVVGITNKSCVSCINCSNACKTNAILRENKQILVDNAECIMCGDCLDSCNKDGMKISRK